MGDGDVNVGGQPPADEPASDPSPEGAHDAPEADEPAGDEPASDPED